jgi:Zn-dependent protease with chaperone function
LKILFVLHVLASCDKPNADEQVLSKVYYGTVTPNKIHDTYVLRFFKNKRIVMYDTLIDQVELPELLAILGHEIGHWQLSHALQGFVVVQVIEVSILNGMTVTAEF